MKTSELIDLTLDWAVAMTLKGNVRYENGIFLNQGDGYEYFTPSTDWSQGGPIIDREKIGMLPAGVHRGDSCEAFIYQPSQHDLVFDDACSHTQYGPTPLIAAMRCYVASKLGDEIEIPEELACGSHHT